MSYFPAAPSLEDEGDQLKEELSEAYQRIVRLESALRKIRDTEFAEFSISEAQRIASDALGE